MAIQCYSDVIHWLSVGIWPDVGSNLTRGETSETRVRAKLQSITQTALFQDPMKVDRLD